MMELNVDWHNTCGFCLMRFLCCTFLFCSNLYMYISMTSYQISNLSAPSITLDVGLNPCAVILHNITELL